MTSMPATTASSSTAKDQSQRPTADTTTSTASTRPCTSTHTTGPTSRKMCILSADHPGDHSSGALCSWPRTDGEPPAGISLAARADIEVELLADADSGKVELILSDDRRRYEVVDKAEALAVIADARTQLDRAADLVAQYDPPAAKPGHFGWCVECEEIVSDSGRNLVDHASTPVRMPAPAGMETEDQVLLDVVITAGDDADEAGPRISFGAAGEAAWLDRAAAAQVLADLEAFTAGFRNLVHQMQQERA